ncbi:P-loop containing nucleoside triphosphate hydrolase protein [Pyronema omphalodes]|nr:P-loop containing nucleoside triphosphate hydrolase protein [Pyronema omphalodes]
MAPILIAIAGGSASGKKSVQTALANSLQSHGTVTVKCLHQTDFVSDKAVELDPEELDAFDLPRLHNEVSRLLEAAEASRDKDSEVIIVEGSFVLLHQGIRDRADVKIFVDADADVRLARRVIRDLAGRQLPLETILDQHVRVSKAAYERHILPTKQVVDIILPGDNINAGVDLVAQGIMDRVTDRKNGKAGTAGFTSGSLHVAAMEFYDTV